MVVKNIFVLLTTIVVIIDVIICTTCIFSSDDGSGFYECLLLNQNIQSDDDMPIIGGSHANGFSAANVTNLRAIDSNIRVFPSLIIDRFPNLTFVRLSGVKMKYLIRPITNCDTLYSINLAENEITTFSGGIFKNCAGLRVIDMQNNGLRFLDSAAFAGTNLTELRLQTNQIEFLQPAMFAHIPFLQVLLLYNNSIQEVLPGTFDLPHLISISFGRNNLTSWSAHKLPSILTLDLYINQITTISSDVFANMPKLSQLDLSYNSITEIPVFKGLNQLRLLSFMTNKLKYVHAESFKNLVSLRYLSLSYNEIESFNFTITDDNFLTNLEELSLSANHLTEIDGFISPVHLTSLTFSYNKLTHLQTNSIQPISQIRYLNVENNEIRKIDKDFFNDAISLTVYMKNNYCFDGDIKISDRDDKNLTMLGNCFNHATNSVSDLFVLVISVCISVILKFLK